MTRQINIRVGEGQFDVLAAAGALEDVSPADLVRAVLEERVQALEADPAVRRVVEERRERARRRRAKEGSTVSSLESKRRGRSGAGDA